MIRRTGLLARLVGDEASRARAPGPGYIATAGRNGSSERSRAARDVAAEAVLQVDDGLLELGSGGDRLLGAEGEPTGIALTGHGTMSSTKAAPRTSAMTPLTTRTRAVSPLKSRCRIGSAASRRALPEAL